MSRMSEEALKCVLRACRVKMAHFTMRERKPPCQPPAKVGKRQFELRSTNYPSSPSGYAEAGEARIRIYVPKGAGKEKKR